MEILGYMVIGKFDETGQIVAYVDDKNEQLFPTVEAALALIDDGGGARPGVTIWIVPVTLDGAIPTQITA
jgi:hypothetical protein